MSGWGDFLVFPLRDPQFRIELDAEQALTSICEGNPMFFKGVFAGTIKLSYKRAATREGLRPGNGRHPRQTRLYSLSGFSVCI